MSCSNPELDRKIYVLCREVGILLWSVSSLLNKHMRPEIVKKISEKLEPHEVNDLAWSLGRVLQCTSDVRDKLVDMPSVQTEYSLDCLVNGRKDQLTEELTAIKAGHPKFPIREYRSSRRSYWCQEFVCPYEECEQTLCFSNDCKEHKHPLAHAIETGHIITHSRAKERKVSHTL